MPWFLRMLLLAALIGVPLYVYFGFRLAAAITRITSLAKRRSRLLVFSFLAWLYALPVLALLSRVSGFSERFFITRHSTGVADYLINYPFWWGLVLILESFPLLVLLDLASLATRLRPSVQQEWIRWKSVVTLTIVAFFLVEVPVHSWRDTRTIRSTDIRADITGIPRELDSLRIVLLGDVQVDRYTNGEMLDRFQNSFRALDADIVLFAGDLVTNGKDFIDQGTEVLCTPRGKVANIAVMGDHDYWSDPVSIPAKLSSCGWTFLQNQHAVVSYKGRRLLITGVTHVYSNHMSEASIREFLNQAPEADFKILLVHQPAETLIRAAASAGYQLFLAGHTHGGQVVLHPLGIPFALSRLETDFYVGNYRFDSVQVVITNGIGVSLAPIRYHAPAEMTFITCRASGANDR
jgi:uncharacterized protein